LLVLIGKDLGILESKGGNKYKVLHKEYYAGLIYYFDRSNPAKLNLSSKNTVSFWGFKFETFKICQYCKNTLDELI
jgi:hypothetical protein